MYSGWGRGSLVRIMELLDRHGIPTPVTTHPRTRVMHPFPADRIYSLPLSVPPSVLDCFLFIASHAKPAAPLAGRFAYPAQPPWLSHLASNCHSALKTCSLTWWRGGMETGGNMSCPHTLDSPTGRPVWLAVFFTSEKDNWGGGGWVRLLTRPKPSH